MTRLVLLVFTCAALVASAGNVPADLKPSSVWKGMRIYRDIAYGPRADAPTEGEAYKSPWTGRDWTGHVYHSHRSGQFCDVFAAEGEIPAGAPVYLNVHGGAWSQPWDKDGEGLRYILKLVKKGFVVFNMNYQLQEDVITRGNEVSRRPHATFDDLVRDIDAMVGFLKDDFLPKMGLAPRAIALGGGSAGAHLSMLYAWDQDNPSVLNLNLRHALRIGFVVDMVGPSDLTSDDFLLPQFERKFPRGSFFDEQALERFFTLFDWLTDADLSTLFARDERDAVRAALRKYSPIHLVTPKSVPAILAYCQRWPFAKTDGCVPTSAYYDLMEKLAAYQVPHAGDIRTFRLHGLLGEGFEQWVADRVGEFAEIYLRQEGN